jgi:hypothetical protein
MKWPATALVCLASFAADAQTVSNTSPLDVKAEFLQRDLKQNHLLEGLYVSIVPVAPRGIELQHTVDEPGNVIHAGVWTGRYLAGVGYQYAVTKDPQARRHGGEILAGLRRLQEVTGKPGLLARGYVKGHGPVEGFERGGADSREWHQGQGRFADYRFYSDVSVDNFNAVLYGYAIYYDLAADAEQKKMIAHDVDRLMTHLLDNHYRIIDLDGEVTQYGHVGIDPDPARDDYYRKVYASVLARYSPGPEWKPSLRASLMALPDLLIAHHITGKQRYADEYRKVIARFAGNPDPMRDTRPYSLERVARVNHSSEGQAYEALFNLMRYEKDPKLSAIYRGWLDDLWEMNWMEGNSLFTYMTLALAPEKTLPRRDEALRLANDTLRRYPVNRIFTPVMNSIRTDLEPNPHADRGGQKQAAKPIPIDERPLDNEDAWKGNPYQMDGWLHPAITALENSCDDPKVAWFSDSAGRVYLTRDGMKSWQDVSLGLLGAKVRNIRASDQRTFVLWVTTDRGVMLTRDGGLSWRVASEGDKPEFRAPRFGDWQRYGRSEFRIGEAGELLRREGAGDGAPAMQAWRIPRATSMFVIPRGVIAGGPGGVYWSQNGTEWSDLVFWKREQTGAADYLHAYWMGRYYAFVR